jgi:hypothetical protein
VAPQRERLPAGISTGLFFEIGAVAIGIARGALDVYENVLRTKLTDVPPFTRVETRSCISITWAVRLAWSIWRRLGCSKPLIVTSRRQTRS